MSNSDWSRREAWKLGVISAVTGGVVAEGGRRTFASGPGHEAWPADQAVTVVDIARTPRGSDSAPALQGALDRAQARRGGTVVVPERADGEPYVTSTTVEIGARCCLVLPSGVVLQGGAAGPVVALTGNHSSIAGRGTVASVGACAHGVVLIVPRTITERAYDGIMSAGSSRLTCPVGPFRRTDVGKNLSIWGAGPDGGKLVTKIADFVSPKVVVVAGAAADDVHDARVYWGAAGNVGWASVSDVRVRGRGTAGSRGIYVNSPPQGGHGLTWGSTIDGCQVEDVDVGVYLGPHANANQVSGVQFYKIRQDAIVIDDSSENSILGGFVHKSTTMRSVVTCRRGLYNTVFGLAAEAGGPALPFDLDSMSRENLIEIANNGRLHGRDRGSQNSSWVRDEMSVARLNVNDGLVLSPRRGEVTDESFRRSPSVGLVAIDEARKRICVRMSDGWSYIALDRGMRRAVVEIQLPGLRRRTTVDLEVEVEGATLGDVVAVSPQVVDGVVDAGLSWCGYVSTEGKVSVRLCNCSDSDIGDRRMRIGIRCLG